jgi:hypothetical protein
MHLSLSHLGAKHMLKFKFLGCHKHLFKFKLICVPYILKFVGRVAQSVYRLTMGGTVLGSNPGGGEIFRTRPDRPWGPPNILYNWYRVFSGGKAAGAWC